MKAIRVERHGGPDVLQPADVAAPPPGPGEVRVAMKAAGLNFIETYHRTGAYASKPPYIPGGEGAGLVDMVGPGVNGYKVGDRVASVGFRGSYADHAIASWERLVHVPDEIDLEVAAAAMLQGMTAQYLVRTTFPLQKGQWCLIHAAAGGVGQLLCRFAKHIGAHVIGTVGSAEKAPLAKEAGAEHVILYRGADVSHGVREIVPDGVHVAYDGVGKDTFSQTVASVRPRGMAVLFGAASGPVLSLDVPSIQRGSLFFTRPALVQYTATRDELLARSSEVFAGIRDGWLPVRVDRRFPLEQAADAHRYLEARQTRGKVLIIP